MSSFYGGLRVVFLLRPSVTCVRSCECLKRASFVLVRFVCLLKLLLEINHAIADRGLVDRRPSNYYRHRMNPVGCKLYLYIFVSFRRANMNVYQIVYDPRLFYIERVIAYVNHNPLQN